MQKALSTLLIISMSFPLTAQISTKKLAKLPSEASGDLAIVVSPKNPLNMAAGLGAGSLYYSVDGGQHWETAASPSLGKGSPVLMANPKGTMHYVHAEKIAGEEFFKVVCNVSEDGGKTWSEAIPVTEPTSKDQLKPWGTYDGKENLYVTWSQFDHYTSTDQNCLSSVFLSRSSSGRKWSKAVEISQTPGDCSNDDLAAAGSMPAVGSDGKIFVAWTQRDMIMLDRSYDGNMFLSNDIAFTQQKAGRNFEVTGAGLTNGKAVLASDRSKGDHRGVLYVFYADKRYNNVSSDVLFSRSLNFGDLWIAPEKVANLGADAHQQYLPWFTIDQSNGHLYVVYYERVAGDETNVYLSWSTDAGQSFKRVKLNAAPFNGQFSGAREYINVSAHKGTIAAIWSQENEVWTAVLKYDDLTKLAQ